MTYGPTFNEARDGERIRGQIATIRELLLPLGYLTLAEIARLTGYPEASISANYAAPQKGGTRFIRRTKTAP